MWCGVWLTIFHGLYVLHFLSCSHHSWCNLGNSVVDSACSAQEDLHCNCDNQRGRQVNIMTTGLQMQDKKWSKDKYTEWYTFVLTVIIGSVSVFTSLFVSLCTFVASSVPCLTFPHTKSALLPPLQVLLEESFALKQQNQWGSMLYSFFFTKRWLLWRFLTWWSLFFNSVLVLGLYLQFRFPCSFLSFLGCCSSYCLHGLLVS